MLRRLIAILLLLPLFASSQEDQLSALLRVDAYKRPDSLSKWTKSYVRTLDSSTAFSLLNTLEKKAVETDNRIAITAIPFLKAEYIGFNDKHPKQVVSYMKQAVALADEYNLDYQSANYRHLLGIHYYYHDQIALAIEYLLQAQEQFQAMGYEHIPSAGMKLYNVAYVYYHLHNYRECLRFLNHSKKYPSEDDYWLKIQLENTFGLVYTELNNYDSAIHYFNSTLRLVLPEDTVWKGIIAGNIGIVYLRQTKYDDALPYLQKNYDYLKGSPGYNTVGATQQALVSLGEIYVAKGNAAKAFEMLNEALRFHDTYRTEYWRERYLYKTLASAYALKGDFAEAYRYERMSEVVEDSITKRDNALSYVHIQQQFESKKLIASMQVLEAEKKAARQKMLFVVTGSGMLLIIGWLMYNRRRLQAKKDLEIAENKKQLLESEKSRVEANLHNAQNLLNEYLDNIRKKNELIELFKKEVARNIIADDAPIQQAEQYEQIRQLEGFVLLTDEGWGKFKDLFEKVYAGFFTRLKDKIPDLTEAETRLLALTKLRINTKHMAQMLGISSASVHTARYRLRKKMAISDEAALDDIVENI